MLRKNDAKVTFGFVAHFIPRGPQGNIQVVDHGTGERYHGRVGNIVCRPETNTVFFSGTLKGRATARAAPSPPW